MRFLRIASLLALLPAAATSATRDYEKTEVWSPVPTTIDAPAGRAPSDAVVLFDGTHLNAWEPARSGAPLWSIEDGAMVVVPQPRPSDLKTRQSFGDVQLHLEFRSPSALQGEGQGRGNSGIFFMGQYELQILDSHQNPTYVNGQAASIYKQHAPLVNASRPPGEWQTLDVVFIAPRFDEGGRLLSPARITAFHNGVLVQLHVALTGPTPNGPTYNQPILPPYAAHAEKLPLILQDHRNPVAFRNIWIRELTLPR